MIQPEVGVRPQPRAAVFACRWCGFLGADRAGREHLQLPTFFRLICVECACAVEADLILRAFANGIDGIAVLGCHQGGCRHNEANRTGAARLELLRDLLDAVGVGSARLLLSWGTAHEAAQFAGLMQDFCNELQAMPELPRSGNTAAERRAELC